MRGAIRLFVAAGGLTIISVTATAGTMSQSGARIATGTFAATAGTNAANSTSPTVRKTSDRRARNRAIGSILHLSVRPELPESQPQLPDRT